MVPLELFSQAACPSLPPAAACHRIGHGVSLVYECNVTGVLEAMQAR